MDPLETIKRLYFNTTRTTVARDLAKAVELLKTLPTEDARERAAVYMDGLSQMRSEWGVKGQTKPPHTAKRPKGPQRPKGPR